MPRTPTGKDAKKVKPPKPFTDLGVKAAKHPNPDSKWSVEKPDGGCRNLYLCIQPGGHKSWTVRFHFAGRTRKMTLGAAGERGLSVAEARKQCTAALSQVAHNVDPIVAKAAAKEAQRKREIEQAGDTVAHVWEVYYKDHVAKTRNNTERAIAGTFKRTILPHLGQRKVADIRHADVLELLHAIAKRHPSAANHLQAVLSHFFKWCEQPHRDRDGRWKPYIAVGTSPCRGLQRVAKPNKRERILCVEEIRSFWAASADLPAALRDIHRLLLLTACRREEVAGMRWREIDMEEMVWTLPPQRSKTKRAHMFPLGADAWSIIEKQPRHDDYVFSMRTGFAKWKQKLDDVMKPHEPWQVRDLRRTARTLMSKAKVAFEVRERMLTHTQGNLVEIYDQHDFLDEMRDGFAKLEQAINAILTNPPAGR